MTLHKWIFLLPVLLMGGIVSGASAPVRDTMTQQVDVGRQEVLHRAELLVRKGNDALARNEYRLAIDSYLQAVKVAEPFRSGTRFQEMTEFCRRQLAVCYNAMAEDAMRKADKLATAQDFEAAIKMCKEALEYCPEQRSRLEEKIRYYEKRHEAARARDEVSKGTLMPNFATQEYQIQLLMEQGRRLAKENELLQARRKFEEILLMDPYNSDALQNLRAVNIRIGTAGTKRFSNISRKMVAEAEWKYSIPLQPEATSESVENQLAEPQLKEENGETTLARRLSEIIIPNINFEERMVTLSQALETLRDVSREADPKKIGVNIVLLPYASAGSAREEDKAESAENPDGPAADVPRARGGRGADRKAAAPAAPAAAGGENNEEEESKEPTVVLNVKNYSVLAILQELEKSAKIKFRVDRNAVVVAPEGVPLDNMQTKFFAVELPSDTDDKQLEEQLKVYGVYFPQGSKIFFDRNLCRVVATNTPDNLKLIGENLQEKFVSQQEMIQVMFRFVEISQDDLDELAFNWSVSTNQSSPDTGGVKMGPSGNNLLSYYQVPDADATAKEAANYNVMWEDARGNRVEASLYALNWAGSEDVLNAPRVTTLSGQTARVEMYERHYYPEDYETEDYESTDEYEVTSVRPQPNLDDEQDLGIGFIITPEVVDPEARLISVKVNIPIKAFAGWEVYDSRVTTAGGSTEGEYIQKPTFTNRAITTDVTVKDGVTIVLGGLAQDVTSSTLDKIPILADIPYIGRFFQSRYSKSEKRNLLIFMTCRMVKPNGVAKYDAEKSNYGLPEFGRNQ